MKKVKKEICSGNLCIDVEVIHRDDGSDSGDVKIICNDLKERDIRMKTISSNFDGRLKPKNLATQDYNELVLVYEDINHVYDILGLDTENKINSLNLRFDIQTDKY